MFFCLAWVCEMTQLFVSFHTHDRRDVRGEYYLLVIVAFCRLTTCAHCSGVKTVCMWSRHLVFCSAKARRMAVISSNCFIIVSRLAPSIDAWVSACSAATMFLTASAWCVFWLMDCVISRRLMREIRILFNKFLY